MLKLNTLHIACFILISFIIGYGNSPIHMILCLLYILYTYFYSYKVCIFSIFSLWMIYLMNGLMDAYILTIIIASMFLWMSFIKYWSLSMLPYMAIGFGLILVPYAWKLFPFDPRGLAFTLLGGLLCELLLIYIWKEGKIYHIYKMGLIMILFHMIGYLIYDPYLIMIILLFIYVPVFYFYKREETLLLLGLSLLFFIQYEIYYMILLFILLLRENKSVLIVVLWMSLFYLPKVGLTYLFVGWCIWWWLVYICYRKRKQTNLFFQNKNQRFTRLLQNYASIFHILSDYYATYSPISSQLFENIEEALQYHAKRLVFEPFMEKEKIKIIEALRLENYHICNIEFDECSSGMMELYLRITRIKRGDIFTTIIPIIEKILKRNIYLFEQRKSHGIYELYFADQKKYHIEAQGMSISNAYTSNGDTYAIFPYLATMITMISDGMGNGTLAKQSSNVVSSLFQRFIRCNIPQSQAIICVNKLLQSDVFATLDVICFHESEGKAYIAKSAACPTFLYRNECLYEICGTSLPIGILSSISPDCFMVDLKDQDIFIMTSDGIAPEEIRQWINEQDITDDVSFTNLTQKLKKEKRIDDSTIIYAKVYINQ